MKSAVEWSQGFDLLWNNIMSDKAPGLEEYEKSMFLTIAQEELVKDVFSPKTNALGEGYDDSIRRQSDFRTLLATASPLPVSASDISAFNARSTPRYYEYPEEAFLVLNEELSVEGKYATVVPLSYDEYARLMMRPYKYPPKGQVWRLITQTGTFASTSTLPERSRQVIELIGNFHVGDIIDYRMRFVQRPKPIILTDLSEIDENLTIEGEQDVMLSELPEHLHDEILVRAVNLAKIAWVDPAAPQGQKQ